MEPGRIDFPNLRVTISELDAGPWGDWAQDFLVKGNNDDSHEKRGAIVFLAPNRKAELGRIVLHNVGIFAFRRAAAAAAKPDRARRGGSVLRADGVPDREAGPRAGSPAPPPRPTDDPITSVAMPQLGAAVLGGFIGGALGVVPALMTSYFGPRKLEEWRAGQQEEREFGPRKELLALMLAISVTRSGHSTC